MVATPAKLHRREHKRSESNLIKIRSSYKNLSLFSRKKNNLPNDKNSPFKGLRNNDSNNKISKDLEISKLAGIKSVTSLGN